MFVILLDKSAEKDESFYIELFDPKNGVKLGSHCKTVVTIINDDGKMVANFYFTNFEYKAKIFKI